MTTGKQIRYVYYKFQGVYSFQGKQGLICATPEIISNIQDKVCENIIVPNYMRRMYMSLDALHWSFAHDNR